MHDGCMMGVCWGCAGLLVWWSESAFIIACGHTCHVDGAVDGIVDSAVDGIVDVAVDGIVSHMTCTQKWFLLCGTHLIPHTLCHHARQEQL